MDIVIADCDHDGFEPELELAASAGITLRIALSADADEFVAHTGDADGVLMQYMPITGELLDRLPALRAIGRYGVGVDTIDVNAATERDIVVSNVPDYGTEAVSDHAIALALSLARGIVYLDRAVRRGSADLRGVRPLREIAGRTFGVVGLGRIGKATARKAAGLGYRVLAYDPDETTGVGFGHADRVGLDELLESSDVVSLHLPLTAQTHHLMDSARIGRLRPGAILVNTSRGGVVDTDALVRALDSGGLGGAGLDVFEIEPLPPGHPLTTLPSVVLTPHAAWYTEESYLRLKRQVLQNVIDACSGRRPRDVLNPQVLGEAVA